MPGPILISVKAVPRDCPFLRSHKNIHEKGFCHILWKKIYIYCNTYKQNVMVPSSKSIKQLTMSPAAHDWEKTYECKHWPQVGFISVCIGPCFYVFIYLPIICGSHIPFAHSVSIVSIRVRSISNSLLDVSDKTMSNDLESRVVINDI